MWRSFDTDLLGYAVRQARIAWFRKRQAMAPPAAGAPAPSSPLAPYDQLPEEEKQADRFVGETVCSMVRAMLKDD